MAIQVPPEVVAVLEAFDSRVDTFEVYKVMSEVEAAIPDPQSLSAEARRGWWTEYVAFALRAREAPDDGPWKTYFQPMMTIGQGEAMQCRPDLRDADGETIAYWSERARAVKHPVLAARYADLVWDTTEFVTREKRGRDKFEYVTRAIDAYVAAALMDDGAAWGDTRDNLTRALKLALSIKDASRTMDAIQATIDYVERTADDDHIGTYCYLFDNLLPPEHGPELTEQQENGIIKMFEAKFAEMTTPGGQWDVDPYGPRDVGLRIAAYYERNGQTDDRKQVLREVAEAFERRAKLGDAMSAPLFLQEARGYFLQAGMKEDVDRVQLEGQRAVPEAQKQLVPMTVECEIPKEDVERLLEWLTEQGMAVGLLRLARHFVPDQVELAKRADEIAAEYPLASIFMESSIVLGGGHIQADIGDDTDDPDGKAVHRTANHLCQFDRWWLHWGLDDMTNKGLDAAQVMQFIRQCSLFAENHIPLVQQGVEAHFAGDFPQSIHLLVPQIERALVNMLPLAGRSSNKAHRTGRGVMQAKGLNDVLKKEEWPLSGESGEQLRVYLLSSLAHPKGLNIRNYVCHGLWPSDHFTKPVSERVLHVLLTVSLIRPGKREDDGTPPSSKATDDAQAPKEPKKAKPKKRGTRTAKKTTRRKRS